MIRILIIEDDTDLREGLSFSLSSEGYTVISAETASDGLREFRYNDFDLVLLDCNLPDKSGYDAASEIKSKSSVPILMLTARNSEMDEVKALELGIDDFMSKPFSLAVLKARIKRLVRSSSAEQILVSGDISIDKNTCKVYKNSQPVDLSKIEYQLLSYLIANEGTVLSKEQILEHVWDSHGSFVDENTLQVNVRRLRAKIEDEPKKPVRLVNVYGIGYIWKRV